MRPEPTAKQKEVLAYLEAEIGRTGSAPSLRQAAEDLGVSHGAVARIIRTLEEKGYLRRDGRYGRQIYLLNRVQEAAAIQRWRQVPIIGRITAGLPLYAQQEWDGTLVVDRAVLGELDPALAARVLRRWLGGGQPDGPERVHVDDALAWLASGRSGTTFDLPGGARLVREFDRVRLEGSGGGAVPLRSAADYRILVAKEPGGEDAAAGKAQPVLFPGRAGQRDRPGELAARFVGVVTQEVDCLAQLKDRVGQRRLGEYHSDCLGDGSRDCQHDPGGCAFGD